MFYINNNIQKNNNCCLCLGYNFSISLCYAVQNYDIHLMKKLMEN